MSRVTGGKHYTIEEKTLFLRMKELVVTLEDTAKVTLWGGGSWTVYCGKQAGRLNTRGEAEGGHL